MNLTHADLCAKLRYDPATGELFWKAASVGVRRPLAGFLHHTGYRVITLKHRQYLAHRLVWFMCKGHPPEGILDHINRNRSDNRIENLRAASYSQNRQNSEVNKNNTSGTPGVFYLKRTNKWQAKIGVNSRSIFLGTFADFESARIARMRAQRKYHMFNRGVS